MAHNVHEFLCKHGVRTPSTEALAYCDVAEHKVLEHLGNVECALLVAMTAVKHGYMRMGDGKTMVIDILRLVGLDRESPMFVAARRVTTAPELVHVIHKVMGVLADAKLTPEAIHKVCATVQRAVPTAKL